MTYNPIECDRLDCTNPWFALTFVRDHDDKLFIAYLCDTCFADEPFGYYEEETDCPEWCDTPSDQSCTKSHWVTVNGGTARV